MVFSSLLTITKLTATTTSSTLATLKGSALSGSLTRLVLKPHTSTDSIYWNTGAASASTDKLPSEGIPLDITKNLADTIQIYGDSKLLTMIELG